MNTKTSHPNDISQLRAQIDAIDLEIARLLVVRTDISQAVAFSKISDAKNANEEMSFGWRPKREIEILRHVKIAEPSLGKRLSYMIWRAMITRNLASQAPMEVICVKESQAPSRIGFGAAISPQVIENCNKALEIAASKENLILSLPWPNEDQNYWLKLLEPKYQKLKINMALPHIDDKTPEALCLAQITPLETGNDYSIIAGKPRIELPPNAHKISAANGFELWQIPGFHADIENHAKGVYFLGAYAIV